MKRDIMCWLVQHGRSVINGHVEDCNVVVKSACKIGDHPFIHNLKIDDAFTDLRKQKEDYSNDNIYFMQCCPQQIWHLCIAPYYLVQYG